MRVLTRSLVLAALLTPCQLAVAKHEPIDRVPLFEGLGTHQRKVTTSAPMAQRYFDQGLAFLYAFNHDEAIASFRQAAEIDPHCAMAWWGIAIANGPHINLPIVDKTHAEAAWQALERAKAEAPNATPAERALIAAAGTRYANPQPEDRKPLDQAYADAMRRVRDEFPTDADVASLYAEALMDLHPWDLWLDDGTPRQGTPDIIAAIESALERDAKHPLALHLYIHALEASPHPEKAVGPADRLRDLAPGLPHLVHMPSHIDVRTGNWAKAVVANGKAMKSDAHYREIRPKQGFYRLYMLHDEHMLTFAAMMRGQSKLAIDTIDHMIASVPADWAEQNAAIADGYLFMPLEVRMRFGRWDEILAAPEPPEIFPLARALRHAARAVAYAAKGQPADGRKEAELFTAASKLVAPEAMFGHSKASDMLGVAENLMLGEILYREGKLDEGLDHLRKAVAIEDTLKYDEPPDWIQPVRHALGAALVREGRYAEAEAVYREDLTRLPNNGWSLFGLSRCLEAQGKGDEAKRIRAQFNEVWNEADVTLSSSCFCLSEK